MSSSGFIKIPFSAKRATASEYSSLKEGSKNLNGSAGYCCPIVSISFA